MKLRNPGSSDYSFDVACDVEVATGSLGPAEHVQDRSWTNVNGGEKPGPVQIGRQGQMVTKKFKPFCERSCACVRSDPEDVQNVFEKTSAFGPKTTCAEKLGKCVDLLCCSNQLFLASVSKCFCKADFFKELKKYAPSIA